MAAVAKEVVRNKNDMLEVSRALSTGPGLAIVSKLRRDAIAPSAINMVKAGFVPFFEWRPALLTFLEDRVGINRSQNVAFVDHINTNALHFDLVVEGPRVARCFRELSVIGPFNHQLFSVTTKEDAVKARAAMTAMRTLAVHIDQAVTYDLSTMKLLRYGSIMSGNGQIIKRSSEALRVAV